MLQDISGSKYQRVALVMPPLDDWQYGLTIGEIWQPLALIALASDAFARGFQGQIKIFDQAVMSKEEMHSELDKFQPDLLGISPTVKSYGSALDIAQKFAQAKIVFGGRWSSVIAENLLRKNPFVDYVVRNDGEEAFAAILAGKNPKDIPNLIYSEAGSIFTSDLMDRNRTATVTPIDYSLVDLEAYFVKRQEIEPNARFKRPITIAASRGCPYRDRLIDTGKTISGCSFCCHDFTARYDDPRAIWSWLREQQDKYRVDGFRETGEDPLGRKGWFEQFHHTRPKDAPGISFIYSRAANINVTTARMLADLNTDNVFIGAESADPMVLKQAKKGGSLNAYLNAVQLLDQHDVGIMIGLVLGLKGESEQSLQRTFELVERLLKFKNVRVIESNLIYVMPGSQNFLDLMNDDPFSRAKWLNEDVLPFADIARRWLEQKTDVSYDGLLRFQERLRRLSPKIVIS